jgi:hypothetical protein
MKIIYKNDIHPLPTTYSNSGSALYIISQDQAFKKY